MTYPILYSPTETSFSNNGLGALSDCLSCVVVEERNGSFEMTMEYPVNGVHYSDIIQRSIIKVKPNPTDAAQPFRVYRITRPIHGVITVYCAHISYDLSGVPVLPFEALSLAGAITDMISNSFVDHPFTLVTDKAVASPMSVQIPTSFRALMGGTEGSLLDLYGGEYKYDVFVIYLLNNRGSNNGVTLRYGKNITSLEQDENCASCYTGVLPYWYSEDDGVVQGVLNPAPVTFNYDNILTLDCSAEFEDKPTEADLNSYAQNYILANNIGVPDVSLTVSYAQDSVLCESVALCDTITVEFPALGVSAYAKVCKTTYNALTGVFDSVDLGNMRTSIAQTIADQSAQISDASTRLYIETKKLVHDWVVTNEQFNSALSDLESRTTQIEQNINTITLAVADNTNAVTTVQSSQDILYTFAHNLIKDDDGNEINLSEYIRFGNGWIVIGRSNSQMKCRIENDKIIFFSGNDFDPVGTSGFTVYARFDPTELIDTIVHALSHVLIGTDSSPNNFAINNNNGNFSIRRI